MSQELTNEYLNEWRAELVKYEDSWNGHRELVTLIDALLAERKEVERLKFVLMQIAEECYDSPLADAKLVSKIGTMALDEVRDSWSLVDRILSRKEPTP